MTSLYLFGRKKNAHDHRQIIVSIKLALAYMGGKHDY